MEHGEENLSYDYYLNAWKDVDLQSDLQVSQRQYYYYYYYYH